MNSGSTCFIALGSNLGDRSANLARAREKMNLKAGSIRSESSIYETEPWGVDPLQPKYLNQVVLLDTRHPPDLLLESLHEVERSLGRVRGTPGEPRLIDLDLLLYGCHNVNESGLTVPHPRMSKRAFVLVPLVEVAPDLRHPVSGVTIRSLLASVDRHGVEMWQPRQPQAP